MTIKKFLIILIFFKLQQPLLIRSKEIVCVINGRKALNVVDERFISFSLDPSILVDGFNVNSTSMKMAQHLSPAFLRLSSPSKHELKFSDDRFLFADDGNSAESITVTPFMWKSINNWITKANLTPIFSIDKQEIDDEFFKSFLDEVGEENINHSYWELNYDFKTGAESLFMYLKNLSMLRKILTLGNSSTSVKIVASLKNENSDVPRRFLKELEDVADAINWEPQDLNAALQEKSKSIVPIWLTASNNNTANKLITFSAALLWAKCMGESAKSGYKVIFDQPIYQELSMDTPIFWVSVIYKTLMGQNVLEVKTMRPPTPESNLNINIYAHCSRRQDSFSKQGAATIFVINNNSFEYTVLVRTANYHSKSVDVHSYILTSDGENSTTVYLNDEKLTLDKLDDYDAENQFVPKYKRLRMGRLTNLNLPKFSIGFFVFPSMRIPICINKEERLQLVTNDLQEDQKMQFLEPTIFDDFFSHRFFEPYVSEELLSPQIPNEFKIFEESQTIVEDDNESEENRKPKIPRKLGVNNKLAARKIELELTDEEIKRILEDRAKLASKNDIEIESDEVQNIMMEAARNLIKKEGGARLKLKKPKLMDRKKRLDVRKRFKNNRHKRDINMDLLMRRIKQRPSLIASKKATVRGSDSLEELFNKDMEQNVKSKYPLEVHAGLATSAGAKSLEDELPWNGECEQARYLNERVRFMSGPPGKSSDEDELPHYHSFYEDLKSAKDIDLQDFPKAELFELEGSNNGKVKSNKLPKTETNPFIFSDDQEYTENTRYKRQVTDLKGDDVRNYKKFMNEQLRVMKRARNNNNKTSKAGIGEKSSPFRKLSDLSEQNNSTLKDQQRQRQNKQKSNLERRKRKKQVNRLKDRRQHEKTNKDISGKYKRAIIFDIYKYETFTEEAWKPQHVSKIKRVPSYSVEIADNFVPKGVLLQNKIKRNLDTGAGINSAENEIEDYPSKKVNKYSKLFDVAKNIENVTFTDKTTESLDSTDGDIIATTTAQLITPYQATEALQTTTKENPDKVTENMGMVSPPPNFIDMIVSVVNATISNVAHLSQKLNEFYPFL